MSQLQFSGASRWARCGLLLIVGVWPAAAQVADLVQVTTLLPAETGGCFVGTPGTDETLFLRSFPGFTGCDLFDGNSDLCLMRRGPGDPAGGTQLSFGDSALLRPSMPADGGFVWFVRNLDLCLAPIDPVQQDICFNLPPTTFVNNASVSPDGSRIALVPRDLNNINLPANAIQLFQASFPTLPLLASYPFVSPPIYPETIDAMAVGDWLVFDASDTPLASGNWGIYVLNVVTGQLRTLIAPIAGYQLRNPAFAQTSDEVITLDAFNNLTAVNTVLTVNIVTGEVREVATTAIFGVPGFNGDDTALVYNREDATVFSGASLRSRPMAADRISPAGAEVNWVTDAGYGVIYRRGVFDPSPVPCTAQLPGIVPVGTLRLGLPAARGQATIELEWDASCSGDATDYAIYEGTIGNWYDHASVVCSTGGATQATFSPGSGNRYFFIVPTTSDREGSYGTDSAGTPRPPAGSPCRTEQTPLGCN